MDTQISVEELKKRTPEAVSPEFALEVDTTDVDLYSGDLALLADDNTERKCKGSILLRLYPAPRIRFRVSGEVPQLGPLWEKGECLLRIPGAVSDVRASLTRFGLGLTSSTVQGVLLETVTIGANEPVESLVYHLPNFHHYYGTSIRSDSGFWRGRIVLRSRQWQVSVDEIPGGAERKKSLEASGGFAFTHAVKVRLADGSPITLAKAESVEDSLYWLFSLMRGFWCGPVLGLGLRGGRKTWQRWTCPRISRWTDVNSWFPTEEANDQNYDSLLEGLLEKLADELWREPLKNAIHMYIESNMPTPSVESSIILTQSALELLGWLQVVECEDGFLSIDGFKRLQASDKIALVLRPLGIPREVPTDLPDLRKQSRELNQTGAEAFTEIRNALVHPMLKHREKLGERGFPVRLQAHQLGLYFLELTLLQSFRYRGAYCNRLQTGQRRQAPEAVPWLG